MAQNAIEALDAKLAALLADWSLSTTFLALLLLAFVAYPIFYSPEPDTHPLLLARQSSAGPVRSRNESANYRSPEVPYGFPLKSGLNVKDAGAPRWAPGRDGDLRDVWREVQKGDSEGGDGIVPKGLIMTVLGKEEVLEHEVEDLSREIGVMGKFLQERVGKGSGRVAVFLPNSVELLNTIFGMYIELFNSGWMNADTMAQHVLSTASRPSCCRTIYRTRRFVRQLTLPARMLWSVRQGLCHWKMSPSTARTSSF